MKRVPKSNGSTSLRVFIGTSANGEDAEACAVIESSLRRRASIPIEIEWLRLSHDPVSSCAGWNTARWSTPWTALRWAVPVICSGRGRAVYFDCPALVLGDVADLESAAFPSGAFLLARREQHDLLMTGCLVFDCAEAMKHLPSLAKMKGDVGAHQGVGALLVRRPALVGTLPEGWGISDQAYARKEPSHAGSVHFVSGHTQPHLPRADARLARLGLTHWFTGTRLPHYCTNLVNMWEEATRIAQKEDYELAQYVPSEPYGSYAIGGADRAMEKRT